MNSIKENGKKEFSNPLCKNFHPITQRFTKLNPNEIFIDFSISQHLMDRIDYIFIAGTECLNISEITAEWKRFTNLYYYLSWVTEKVKVQTTELICFVHFWITHEILYGIDTNIEYLKLKFQIGTIRKTSVIFVNASKINVSFF